MKKTNKIENEGKKSNSSTFIGCFSDPSKDQKMIEVKVTFGKSELELSFDEVEMKLYDVAEAKTKSENCQLHKIFIVDDKNYKYPVFSESDPNLEIEQKYSKFEKILVLPNAVYSISTEYKLYKALINEGLLNANARFDANAMHRILNAIGFKRED